MADGRHKRNPVAFIAGATLLLGCSDLSRFSTNTGESYCGSVIDAGFVRAGIPIGTTMRLQLDATQLQVSPGTLWVSNPIGSAGVASAVTIEPIPQLSNDPLSSFTFGEGRVANSIAVIHVGGVEIWVVLSLLQSGDVEVRLMHGSPTQQAATAQQDLQIFGVFQLQKQEGDCSSQ
jgi:hypothetical protein